MNVEIVWDLVSVLREYFKAEIEVSKDLGVSNVLAGLLCAF